MLGRDAGLKSPKRVSKNKSRQQKLTAEKELRTES